MHVMKLQEAREHLSKVVYDAIYNDPHQFIIQLASADKKFDKVMAHEWLIKTLCEPGKSEFARLISNGVLDSDVCSAEEVAETWVTVYDQGPKVVYDPGTDSLVTVPE